MIIEFMLITKGWVNMIFIMKIYLGTTSLDTIWMKFNCRDAMSLGEAQGETCGCYLCGYVYVCTPILGLAGLKVTSLC